MMKKFCSKFEFRWEYFLILFILLEVLVFGMMNSKFLMPRVLFGSFNDFISICIKQLLFYWRNRDILIFVIFPISKPSKK